MSECTICGTQGRIFVLLDDRPVCDLCLLEKLRQPHLEAMTVKILDEEHKDE